MHDDGARRPDGVYMTDKKIFKELEFPQRSEEWLKARQDGIGSSDIAAVMGKSPWDTPTDVFYDKTADEPIQKEVTPAMQWGVDHEPEALEAYCKVSGEVIGDPVGLCVSTLFDYIRASPDGFSVSMDRLVELKCPHSQELPNEVPTYYNMQVQWIMMVTGIRKAHLFFWAPNGHRIFDIEPDEDLMHDMMEAAKAFWFEHVVIGVKPKKAEAVDMSEDDAWKKLVARYRIIKEKADSYAAQVKEVKTGLRALANDKKAKGCGATLYSAFRPRVDWKTPAQEAGIIPIEKEPSESWSVRLSK